MLWRHKLVGTAYLIVDAEFIRGSEGRWKNLLAVSGEHQPHRYETALNT